MAGHTSLKAIVPSKPIASVKILATEIRNKHPYTVSHRGESVSRYCAEEDIHVLKIDLQGAVFRMTDNTGTN